MFHVAFSILFYHTWNLNLDLRETAISGKSRVKRAAAKKDELPASLFLTVKAIGCIAESVFVLRFDEMSDLWERIFKLTRRYDP